MSKLYVLFAILTVSSTLFSTNALALSRQDIINCETPVVQEEFLTNLQAIDDIANGLLARSGDDRLAKKMMEFGQKSTSCDEYIAITNGFLKQVKEDLKQLDKTLTLAK